MALALALAVACSLACHSGAKRRNLLLPLPVILSAAEGSPHWPLPLPLLVSRHHPERSEGPLYWPVLLASLYVSSGAHHSGFPSGAPSNRPPAGSPLLNRVSQPFLPAHSHLLGEPHAVVEERRIFLCRAGEVEKLTCHLKLGRRTGDGVGRVQRSSIHKAPSIRNADDSQESHKGVNALAPGIRAVLPIWMVRTSSAGNLSYPVSASKD